MTPGEWLVGHYATLQTYARYACYGNIERAEDVLQSVIQAVLEGRVGVDFEQSPLTYLQLVIKREASRGPEHWVLVGDEQMDQVSVVVQDDTTTDDLICRGIRTLKPIYQDAVWLSRQGLSQYEIAHRLGVSREVVKWRLERALVLLKAWVQVQCANEAEDDRVL